MHQKTKDNDNKWRLRDKPVKELSQQEACKTLSLEGH